MKKYLKLVCLIVMLLIIPTLVNASDDTEYTTTSTINGVTANLQYKLDEKNQVIELKCLNAEEISGELTVPSTVDGKTVFSVGGDAFRDSKITSLTIPSSVKKLGYKAFYGCSSLSKINLGQVESISFDVFDDCTSLKEITIPKTLNDAGLSGAFIGCTNLKNIILEQGLTIIPATIFEKTPIESIAIPSSVKEIGYNAFKGCTNLSKVDLGQVEDISFDAFSDCTSLKEITIPKTLKYGGGNGSFRGCTNLKSITLEQGLTVIPDTIFEQTPIESITIPNSVKEIGYNAFKGCTNLSKVDLGQVENISFNVFQDCPSLKEITIPKTLIDGPLVNGVFTGTTNLTNAIFEDGITEIPDYILGNCSGITNIKIPNSVTKINANAFRGTSITEITIPNKVKEIEYDVFTDCKKLNKITILDNVESIGFYSLYKNKDTVFVNHNDNLTIYCYKDSTAANYAKDVKIKYVYLNKTTTSNNEKNNTTKEDNTTKGNTNSNSTSINTNKKTTKNNSNTDSTIANKILPYTGSISIIMLIIGISLISIFAYLKVKKYKDVK